MTRTEAATGRLLASPELRHDEAQLALAAAFSGADPEPLLERLDEASRPLFGVAEAGAREQADALADQLIGGLRLVPEELDHRALLLDRALGAGRAHPLLIAVLGHELARRAGIPCFVGVAGDRHFAVVHGVGGMALVGSDLPDTPPLPTTVRLRCPHQVAHAVLIRLRHAGPPAWAPRAERLLGQLPVRRCARGG